MAPGSHHAPLLRAAETCAPEVSCCQGIHHADAAGESCQGVWQPVGLVVHSYGLMVDYMQAAHVWALCFGQDGSNM